MIRRAFFIAVLLSGCVERDIIKASDGKRAYLIQCPRQRWECLDEAAAACPHGYRILDDESRTGVVGANGYVTSTYRGSMVVRCKRAHAD